MTLDSYITYKPNNNYRQETIQNCMLSINNVSDNIKLVATKHTPPPEDRFINHPASIIGTERRFLKLPGRLTVFGPF